MKTFGEKWPAMEDNLWSKTSIGGGEPSIKDNLYWNITCNSRQHSKEDDFYESQPSVTDDNWWKASINVVQCPHSKAENSVAKICDFDDEVNNLRV